MFNTIIYCMVYFKTHDLLVSLSDITSMSVRGNNVIVSHTGGNKDTLVCGDADVALSLFQVVSDFIGLNSETSIVTENNWQDLRGQIPKIGGQYLDVKMA